MAQKNQIALTLANHTVSVTPAPKQARPSASDVQDLQTRLQAQLQETAAYRAYFVKADSEALINSADGPAIVT
jgi:hypothetical protein